MKPRIQKIKVNRDGPLMRDFEITPADLNLIYGLNETGKTYLLESLVRLLFKMNVKQAREEWKLRDWDSNGKIEMSGLEGNGASTSFMKSSKKRFEDYLGGTSEGLPLDFSRLLVVRAGETVLSGDPDGIGQDILKDYLSENRLLDELKSEKNIEKILHSAEIKDGEIQGTQQGVIKKRTIKKTEVDSIKGLLERVDQNFSKGRLSTLGKELEEKKASQTRLERAKKHKSHQLREKLIELQDKSSNLVKESDLGKMDGKIEEYHRKEKRVSNLEGKLGDLKATEEKHDWCVEARQSWDGIEDCGDAREPGIGWGITIGVSILAVVIFGLADQPWLMVSAGILGLGALLISLVKLTRVRPGAGKAELTFETMRQTYKKYFDEPLDDPNQLSVKERALAKAMIEIQGQSEILEDGKKEVSQLVEEIKIFFSSKGGVRDLEPGKWEKVLKKMEVEVKDIKLEVRGCERELDKLSVNPEHDREENPGVPWDADKFNVLSQEISDLEGAIQEEGDDLLTLREKVAEVAGKSPRAPWAALLKDLQDLQESTVRKYKERTAKILAKIRLLEVLGEIELKENDRIQQGLEKDALRSPLSALTAGRYESIHLIEEDVLQLSDSNGNSYSLEKLSTGVREQVCLALRFGFASVALGGEPGFLLLDDAFQHSDWERRPRMIEYMVKLVKEGWQVFYFTMDKHIRERFEEAGHALGSDRFLSMDLGAGDSA